MKYLKFIIPLLLIANAWAITGQGSSRSAGTNAHTEKALHMGEHVPVEYSGSANISGTNSYAYYTQWMQIGWGNDANIYHNNEISVYNPEIFTLFTLLSKYGVGDSARVTDAKFQTAFDAADTVVTVTLTCGQEDTVAVGDILTGDASGASCVVTSTTLSSGAGDSIIVASMYPGNVFDTTNDSIAVGSDAVTFTISAASYANTGIAENADSSNVFIDDGTYSHDQYGTWRYEDYGRTDIKHIFRLRVFSGAYIRFYFACDNVADTSTVTWELKGEN